MFAAGQEGIDRLKIGSGGANVVKIDLLPVEFGDRHVPFSAVLVCLCRVHGAAVAADGEKSGQCPFVYRGKCCSCLSSNFLLVF